MLLRELFEGPDADAAFCFGRFNPAHQGHIEVWKAVQGAGHKWFVGTNPSTQGPNDPLRFEDKSAWMEAIYPPIKGHIMPEQSVVTLASRLYKMLGEGKTIAYVTDSNDWAWAGKVLNDYNGKEGPHGYYKFAKINHVESPRVSSATALRTAARAGDEAAFYAASGTDPKLTIGGKTYYEAVVASVYANPEKVKKAKKEKAVAEGLPQTLRKVVPGYAKREIDKKMDAGKFGKTDADKDANFQRYKKIQDKIKEQGVAEAFGPLPRERQQIRLGRHTVDIERVGLDKDYIGFAWHDSQGQEHYEEVQVGDLGSYDDLIDRIKDEIRYQERQYVADGAPIVVAQAPIDVRNPKKASQPYRNQGDIVPDTKPASTEKRGVKGRPGQRPMPDYNLKDSIAELSSELLGKYKKAASADTSKADKAGDFKRGDKRFSGIVKATKKQFSNDSKGMK